MKQCTVARGPSTDEGTFGQFKTADGKLTLHSLELPWRDLNGDGIGDPQYSCITPGTYTLKWHESPHHGWCYLVTGVAQRSDILVHSANFAGDVRKGWVSELLGCIALGYGAGAMTPDPAKWPGAKVQHAITQSRAACAAFYAWGAGEDIELTLA